MGVRHCRQRMQRDYSEASLESTWWMRPSIYTRLAVVIDVIEAKGDNMEGVGAFARAHWNIRSTEYSTKPKLQFKCVAYKLQKSV